MRSTGHSVLILLQTLLCLGLVQGHGRLIEPPSRSSMWRFGYNTPPNYDDAQLFCGGVGLQYSSVVGGKCGVCGDPWTGPRENEVGGKYATGIIVRTYKVGQVIDVIVDLTANHKGYFEFRLCKKDDGSKRATWDCMNKHVLVDDKTGLTRHAIEYVQYSTKVSLKLRLPKDVKCKACVLQWKYNTGNSWGVDENGKGCIGCGDQEQFYGCADVVIGYEDIPEARRGDPKCVFKQVRGDEWRWQCAGHNIQPYQTPGGAGMDHPLLFTYCLSTLLAISYHAMFFC